MHAHHRLHAPSRFLYFCCHCCLAAGNASTCVLITAFPSFCVLICLTAGRASTGAPSAPGSCSPPAGCWRASGPHCGPGRTLQQRAWSCLQTSWPRYVQHGMCLQCGPDVDPVYVNDDVGSSLSEHCCTVTLHAWQCQQHATSTQRTGGFCKHQTSRLYMHRHE